MSTIKKSIILLLLNIFAFSFLSFGQYEIKRIEPAFWWTGMEHTEVQVMLYGNEIGELKPEINYPGVTLTKALATANKNYLFIYLDISRSAKPGMVNITLQKDDKNIQKIKYQLKARKPQSASRAGFNSSDVIYLLYPDRFANGNEANDNIRGYEDKLNRADDYGRHGGDLQGIIDHLDYIEEMGFTALWLNPVMESAMPRASYHGYAITDFYRVDPRLGNNELYVKLSEEADKRGIKLIQDMIMNHCGANHWWMQDPPSSDWVHYPEQKTNTNHRRVTLHDPYASEADKDVFEQGWFVNAMPDMNQDNKLLADYLIYNSVWWIEQANLGGIRHDTHPYSDAEFLNRWTCHIMEEYPNFNIVGEEWSLSPIVLAKWQRGSNLPVDFSSCLPSLMDFPIQVSLVEALTEKEGWNTGFIKVYEKLASDYLYPDPMNLVIFPDNHDMDRFYRQVNEDLDLFKMGIAYMLTMRGIPQIQYGTEVLMSNTKPHDHGQIREDFPGGWADDKTNAFTGKNLAEPKTEAQHFIKTLLNWRKNNSTIHHGKLMQYAPTHDGTYVYFRYDSDHTIMVVFNKNKEAAKINTSHFYERTKGFTSGRDIITGKEYKIENLNAPARSVLILELK
ncbi:glycoside hydrolase family 13 protein [Salinivirga cyanobacteriivorans]|nr:glycoside hydrolase family 13 protein [Salinivirga cyanobacteriivorans]